MADEAVQHHVERQRLLKTLKDAGMLLVALSKNSPDNVRWEEMALSPSDFVLLKINWDLKAQSIVRAAQELDLGLDSFVLIDDNPAERELITDRAAERPAAGRHRLRTPGARWSDCWPSRTPAPPRRPGPAPRCTACQAQRREAQSQAFDYPAMMAALELEAGFGLATSRDLDRVTELIQRTNQFNTTTIRYTRSDLQKFLESPAHAVYVADLADKFGKLGLVGVVIAAREGSSVTFDSFVMSCRAMGFGLERLMLRAVMDAEADAVTFIGRFVPTDRNTPASGLFQEHGFLQEDPTTWKLDRSTPLPATPEWIRVVRRG